MPTYEYVCQSCGRQFTVIESLAEHEKPHVCPSCGSSEVRQALSPFTAKTSRKS